MSEKISNLKVKYRSNPAWCWLISTIFLFSILPEYISPFILFAGFIVFKRQWTKEGRKARMGDLGKMEFIFLVLTLVSTLWSATKLDTLATSGLWFGMFLIQIMIYNLARSRQRIDKIISTLILSGVINAIVGIIQICTYTLNRYGLLPKSLVLVTPFYRNLDIAIYQWLPFDISTKMWTQRASGFFSNPNLLATLMVVVFPLSIYKFLNAKTKKEKWLYFAANVIISGGMSSTLTRAGCVVALAGWLIMSIILVKNNFKKMFTIFIPTIAVIIPSMLTRYGLIFKSTKEMVSSTISPEAKTSSVTHFQIWESLIDFLFDNIGAMIIGVGFGVSKTGEILRTYYNLDKPHAHNFLIEFWVELGIIGICAFALIIMVAVAKMIVINANNGKKFTLVVCTTMSLLMLLLFGLSDFIFNSPKQIVLFFMVMGLIQSIAHVYESMEVHSANDLIKVARNDVQNALK